ncbi:hypothetical protein [Rufibacter hautae]|uniref:HEAT repeat domain-containing protein n=1 Tax=Rufibacter hautae TaxID=2595005 RepID=A0A5B6TCM8_9BACT|nr:hypothetical protein [Rufibacter hautae]KAA3437641.1 hypothetical protein FOA19_10045 [Rufibacter hautae]
MSQGFLLKSENKPTLFSWDLETETKNVERWVLDNKNYSKRDIEKELSILKNLAFDFLQVIQEKHVSPEQLDRLEQAISSGAAGVWENAALKLERLSYHFITAKERIEKLIYSTDVKIVDRALTMLNESFSEREQYDIISCALSHNSKKIRARALGTVYKLKKKVFLNILERRRGIETESEIKETIDFTLDFLKN